ncbi:recombinase family protein [Brevibacillus borstelensis]|uniref:recombinase family protein n=1 Tax=Brevibacillus borstelensis TaxID=45462 RepID=UPI0004F2A9B9|nr:recombinase family protein [Brevibacillus borstelensis]KKX53507.1 DNA recombinase [Brevibacillus borstelensis cifa_chp40]
MRTVVYIRVSTEEQASDGFSMAAQKERLTAYISSQGWTLSTIYADEGFSAKDTKRPALQRMLGDIRSGSIDVVLVYRLDRLTRSVLDLYRLLQDFEKYGVRFKSCTEVYDTTTAIGRLFITLVAALAQWERENLGERVKLGMEQMARERKRPGGPPPYGYMLHHHQLIPHPEEAKVVSRMYQQYLSGYTPGQIAEKANRDGHLGKHGGKWSGSTVTRLLRNPVYYGALRWNYAEAGGQQNKRDEWILVEDAHPAIVDRETFLKVQERMGLRQRTHPRVLSSPFVFSGLLYCARCKAEMRGKTADIRKGGGKRYRHIYYLCKNRANGICQAPALREDRLEDEVLGQLSSAQEEMGSVFRRIVQERCRSSTAAADDRKQLTKKRQRWMKAYEAGVITLEELAARQQDLRRLEQEMSSGGNEAFFAPGAIDWRQWTDWKWIWQQAAREERRHLALLLLERVEAEAWTTQGKKKQRTVKVRAIFYR